MFRKKTMRHRHRGAKKWGPGHLWRSKGEACRTELTVGLCFRGKVPREANGEAQRAKPKFVAERWGRRAEPNFWVWLFCGKQDSLVRPASKFLARPKLSCQMVFLREPVCHTVVDCSFSSHSFPTTVLPSCRGLIPCTIARKSLKMDDFSKTGSRNMAETCAIAMRSWRGFQGVSPLWEPYWQTQKLRLSASPFSRNLGVKVFLFGPLAAELRTIANEDFSSSWRKWSSLTTWNLVVVARLPAEIFEVKRNSNFPVPNIEIRYACPHPLLLYKNTIDRVV